MRSAVFVVVAASAAAVYRAPVIGVVTQPYTDPIPSYIPEDSPDAEAMKKAGSFIKRRVGEWIEDAGAAAVPIYWDMDDAALEKLLTKLDGVVYTGGGQDDDGPYADSLKRIHKFVTQSEHEIPTFAICMGFQMAQMFDSGSTDVLTRHVAKYKFHPLIFRSLEDESGTDDLDRPFYFESSMPQDVKFTLAAMKAVTNNHSYGIGTFDFLGKSLNNLYHVTAFDVDDNNEEIIGMIEHRLKPFAAVQFHPENDPKHFLNMNEPNDAITRANKWFAEAFVERTKQRKAALDRAHPHRWSALQVEKMRFTKGGSFPHTNSTMGFTEDYIYLPSQVDKQTDKPSRFDFRWNTTNAMEAYEASFEAIKRRKERDAEEEEPERM